MEAVHPDSALDGGEAELHGGVGDRCLKPCAYSVLANRMTLLNEGVWSFRSATSWLTPSSSPPYIVSLSYIIYTAIASHRGCE
jgi:hypothetical protein